MAIAAGSFAEEQRHERGGDGSLEVEATEYKYTENGTVWCTSYRMDMAIYRIVISPTRIRRLGEYGATKAGRNFELVPPMTKRLIVSDTRQFEVT